MSYFKTKDQAALATVNQFFADKQALHDQALSFAALFAAQKPIFYHSSNECWLGGLIFNPAKDDRFWTKPDRKDSTQRPRTKVSKMTDTEAKAHEQLLQQWQNFPKMRPSIETNLTLGENVTEILGSEYKAAKTAFEAANRERQPLQKLSHATS